MTAVDDGEVEVDLCTGCGALFLDRGELEDQGGVLPHDLLADRSGPNRSCPSCRQPMALLRSALMEVDICHDCEGLFLDAGEIDILVNAKRLQLRAEAADPKAAQVFWCDFCRRRSPTSEQIIGELVTCCPECAVRHEIRHDPAARRRFERRRERDAKYRPPLLGCLYGHPAGHLSMPAGILDVLFAGLFGALRR